MAQQVYEVAELPDSGIAASAALFSDHLQAACALIGQGEGESLVISLPPASSDHHDWRIALARDLARARAPARVNVIAGSDDEKLAEILHYLASAKGVTGQYLETHE